MIAAKRKSGKKNRSDELMRKVGKKLQKLVAVKVPSHYLASLFEDAQERGDTRTAKYLSGKLAANGWAEVHTA